MIFIPLTSKTRQRALVPGCCRYSWPCEQGCKIKITNKWLRVFGFLRIQWDQCLCTKSLSPVQLFVNNSVQFSHLVLSDSATMYRSIPGLPVHHQLPESTQTHVHQVGDAIQPSHPLLPPSPPVPNPSQHQGLFQWVNSSHPKYWTNYWSFSFSISPSNEHPGLISFRMDWLDLLAVQGTFKSLLQL